MKFVIPSKSILMVALGAGLLAALPLFVVLAAQGQITEVNPSGISSVQSTVNVGTADDPKKLNIDAKTSWKVIPGQGKNSSVMASFYFNAVDTDGDGSPVFTCKETGKSLFKVVQACLDKLPDAESDPGLAALRDGIEDFRDAALDGLDAFGLDGASENLGSGIAGG
jgi:hypothetical protein